MRTHVLIIGAGVGGLCLAHGLRRAGIEVSVFDRDASADFRGQGWRLTVKETGSRALRACLPPHLFDRCVETSLEPATRLVVADHRLNPRFANPVPPYPRDQVFGVNRLTLREILLNDLDVRFGKTFTGYRTTEDGGIRAVFADGSQADGDLLVGADGVASAVRGQLVPDAEIEDLGRMIYGRTPLTERTLDWLPGVFTDGFNITSDPAGTSFGAVACRARGGHPGLTPVPDYLAWSLRGWPGASTIAADEFRRWDGERLRGLALDTLRRAGWHPGAVQVVAEAEAEATFPVNLHSARPVRPWHEPGVTLLGDAVHAMSPGQGEGANTALRDAALLTELLATLPPPEAKARYEKEMLEYGFAAVAASRTRPLFTR
ncbi:NAD(P)/FAD-dependent oxidoreductase [Streptosporangium sp. NPDC020145]|uniref:FAD-dependent oxidoreductase n=1 Tax=Streptosporangium sp. NPDC020145 TaxID=3154694 RepID=UPI00342FA409